MSQAAALSLPQRDSTGGRRTSYRLTEFGQIPKDWEIVRLGQLAKFITSGSRGWAKYYSDTGALFVRSQNVRSGRLDFTDQQYVTPPVGGEGTRTRICSGDILITITGNSVGNVASVNSEIGEAYISQHVGLVRLETPSQARFVTIFLAPGSIGNLQILGSQSGQSKPGLNLRNLEDFAIALPPPDEQLAITNALSDADALIESLEQLIAQKRHIKQGAMQELLTGKRRLPGFERKKGYQQTQVGTIPNDWDAFLLSAVCTMKSGESITSSNIDQSSRYRCYGGNGLRGYTKRYTHDGLYALVGRQGALCGNVLGVEGKFFASEHAIVVAAHSDADIGWLTHVLGRMRLNQYSESSAQPGLSVSKLLALSVAVPPTKAEQTAIAAILSDMDAEIAALETKLAKSRQIKQGMMHNLLTGRIRLA